MTRRLMLASAIAVPAAVAAKEIQREEPPVEAQPFLHADVRAAADRAAAEGQHDVAMILGGLAHFLADPSRASLDMRSFETRNHLGVYMSLQVQLGR